ncbi:MAG: glycosyltransferase family 2 protein, partial [Aeriscardovia sp.]|nr:glycosyltransferase family 2 protein [Aeriscardovia sp.]
MLSVSVIIPAWNEEERIAECLTCATRQTVAAKEILVVNNNSTDNTEKIVRKFIAQNPRCNVKILNQSQRQGLIPTRNFGFAHATGDIFGRIDADCMMDPHWVEVVTSSFAHDKSVMGLTGPVTYYDMPARIVSLVGDNQIRKRVYKADGGKVLLFGSNMAIRAKAWNIIKGQVCEDLADEIHEDIDVSLHLIANGLKTAYNPKMIVGMSARRMEDSKSDFLTYMRRFK